MVIFQQGMNRIRDLIYDDVDYGQLGTATLAATELQTASTRAGIPRFILSAFGEIYPQHRVLQTTVVEEGEIDLRV